MPLSLFDNKEEVSLLIDIGNGSVSGALVLFGNGAKPALLYSARLPLTVNDKSDSAKLISSMTASLGEVLLSIMKKGLLVPYFKTKPKNVSAVLVSFSSPWFASRAKNLHLAQDTPFIITKKFLDSVVAAEEKAFEEDLQNGEYENLFDKNIQILENTIIHTKINGYPIEECVGKKTKTLDTSLFMSVASKSIINIISDQIFKNTHIHKNKIYFHTFPLISFSVIRDLFPATSNFLVLDITSETTDMTLVSDNAIAKVLSFPSGRNFIIRQISKSFGVSAEIAESYLHAYNSKKTDDETNLRIDSALSDVEKEWSIYFEDAFAELSKDSVLPPRAYITTDPDVASLYSHFLKLPKLDSTSLFRKSVEVIHISAGILSAVYKDDPHFPPDEFVAMIAAFYNKICTK